MNENNINSAIDVDVDAEVVAAVEKETSNWVNKFLIWAICLSVFITIMPIILGAFGIECPCVYLFRGIKGI